MPAQVWSFVIVRVSTCWGVTGREQADTNKWKWPFPSHLITPIRAYASPAAESMYNHPISMDTSMALSVECPSRTRHGSRIITKAAITNTLPHRCPMFLHMIVSMACPSIDVTPGQRGIICTITPPPILFQWIFHRPMKMKTDRLISSLITKICGRVSTSKKQKWS